MNIIKKILKKNKILKEEIEKENSFIEILKKNIKKRKH